MKLVTGICLLLLGCALMLAGCGGGSGGTGTSDPTRTQGTVQFSIVWPSPTRVIPAGAQSLTISISEGGTIIQQQTVSRPQTGNTSTVFFRALPVGPATITIKAYPNPDGTGVVQGIGVQNVAIIAGQTISTTVDINSTIDHLDFSPNPLAIIVGQTAQLVVTAKDSSNNVVLVPPGNFVFSLDNGTLATFDANGNFTGTNVGYGTITVTEKDSGQTITVLLIVTIPVVVIPGDVTLTLLDTQQFRAITTGLSGTGVTWSVQEQGGGTIDENGFYTAPRVPGVFHVIATSTADPTKSGSATVTVEAGSGTIHIQQLGGRHK